MGIIDLMKTYKAPMAEVIEVNVNGMLCNSMNGSFGLKNSDVEKGDDSVWGENPGW